MDLNSLLREVSIDPETTLVLRHRPKEPDLRRVLPWLAAEQPDVFNAYQQTQTPKVEKQMMKASHVVSLIGDQGGRGLFVGLYENQGHRVTRLSDRRKISGKCELSKYGHLVHGKKCLWFDLSLTEHFQDWAGKLIVRWPPPEISWSRWSAKNRFDVIAIREESLLNQHMPDWRDMTFTWHDL